MEEQLLAALEQLEAVEAALLTHPTDVDLLRARTELTELLSLSSSLLQPAPAPADAAGSAQDKREGQVADMFGADDDEWERTHAREFAQHTQRQTSGSATTSSRKRKYSDDESEDEEEDDDEGDCDPEPAAKSAAHAEVEEPAEEDWIACRAVTTETINPYGSARRVWRDALLHSKRPDAEGRYRVTFLHNRTTQEVRPEDVLLQGTTLKHLNYQEETPTERRRRKMLNPDNDQEDSSDDDFEGFSLMRATGGHNYVVGEWESFTNGIGSKLLAKMGYTPGKGLGRQGEGIVKPLGIDFKAPSKKNELLGLGHEDRNKDKEKQTDEAGNPIGPRKKRRRGKKKKQKTEEEEQPKTDMFDFLNDLGQAKKKSSEGSVKEAQAKDRSSRNDALYKKMTPKELEDRLKKKLIEKDDLVGKIQSLEESAKRNRARDPALAMQARQRMKEERTKLHALHSEIKELTIRVKIKEGTKKAVIF